jgi:hypothetical protein
MESYFRERSQLFSAGSTFSCPDACDPLEGIERTIDQTATVIQGSPVWMAYPFGGDKLIPIRLKRDRWLL